MWSRILFAASCLFVASAASCGSESAAARPNVVLVLIDTLRPDHLPFYGYERDTAPFLSELAAQSAVFERAFSASTWTAPATASLFTSLYPPQHGVTRGFFVHRAKLAEQGKLDPARLTLTRLPESLPTLPELFQRAGYDTLGISTNVNIGNEIGFDRGFDEFARMYGDEHPKGASAADVAARLKTWTSKLEDDRPNFVYLHLNDVHEPYEPGANHFGEHGEPSLANIEEARARYDSEIRELDATLAGMYREFAMDRNTLFVLVSDHGEEFMEHGDTGHKFSVYRELCQIALTIRAPELGIAPQRVANNVSIIDVAPTLAELCDLPWPGDLEGRSLAPLLGVVSPSASRRDDTARPLFVHRSNRDLKKPSAARERESAVELWAVIEGDWKLIQRGDEFELYDFATDPLEAHNRFTERPEIAARLRHSLATFQNNARNRGGTDVELDIDAAREGALKELGYAGEK